jgi:hypothetical protein
MPRLLVCFAVLLSLSGCGGDEPRTAVSKPPPTAAPHLPPAPSMPAAAKKRTTAGSVAFARYFVAVRNHALGTGQTDQLRRLIVAECIECQATPGLIETAYRGGGRIEGGGWQIRWAGTPSNPPPPLPGPPRPMQYASVDLSVHITPQIVYAGSDSAPRSYPGSNHDRSLGFGLTWRDGHWCLDQVMTFTGQLL